MIVFVGALTIALWNSGGSRGSHPYWLGVVLAENALALLVRRRHPVGALAGVNAAYLVFDALAVSLLPIVLAISTVAASTRRRTIWLACAATALVVISVPAVHRDPFDLLHVFLPLTVLGLAAFGAAYVGKRRIRASRRSGRDLAVPQLTP
jgi:hypothetical protein